MEDHESDRLDGLPHPRDVPHLFGHFSAERDLLEAYRSGRLAHAWLIGGPNGIGKATLAWRFARFLMAHPDPASRVVRDARTLDVAADHPVWGRLRSGALADMAVLRRQWNDKTKKFFSEIRVDDVRAALQMFQRAAGAGGYRICILDSADDLNRSSANALLKAIEEPPQKSLFLIVSHQPAQVMPTILSRCRKLMLGGLPAQAVTDALAALGATDAGLPPADLGAAIARSGGSVSGTLALLEGDRLAFDRELRGELDRLPALDWRALHRVADRIGGLEAGRSSTILLDTILEWIDGRVRAAVRGGVAARRLAPLAEVWDKALASAREADALNLDKRPLLLSIFADLAQATRRVE